MNCPDWFRNKDLLLSFWFANHADLLESTNLEIKSHICTFISLHLRFLSELAEINAEYIAMKRRAAGVNGIMSTARRFKFPTFPVSIQRSHPSRRFHCLHRLT
jgi:hypothetical protein